MSVSEALNENFPNTWNGRDGPISWPLRSPDLLLLNYFFCVYKIVHSERMTDISHLKRRTMAETKTVTPEMLHRTWKKIEYSLDVCRATNGAYIEKNLKLTWYFFNILMLNLFFYVFFYLRNTNL